MSNLYERLGGEPAVNAAVDIFYKKVLADDSINHFFVNTDMEKQIKKQKAFLTLAFGGPTVYQGMGLRKAHKNMNLTDAHFDAVIGHLGTTLVELEVPEELIAEVAAIGESTRKDVLNR